MRENRQSSEQLPVRPRRGKTSRVIFYAGLGCLVVTAVTAHFTRDFSNPISAILICTFGFGSLILMVVARVMFRAKL